MPKYNNEMTIYVCKNKEFNNERVSSELEGVHGWYHCVEGDGSP